MGDEQSTTQRTTSSQKYERSMHQRQAEYATERAKILFGCYRRGDANDPDTYVAAVALVLSKYAVEVIKAVTDPYSGLPSKKNEKGYSGMPDVADVREACDNEVARITRIDRLRALPPVDFSTARLPRPAPAPGDLAKVFVPDSNVRYQSLVAWSKTEANNRLWKFDKGGIWVAFNIWHSTPVQTRRSAIEPGLDRLRLSEETLRTMREVDAERYGELPIDQPALHEVVG